MMWREEVLKWYEDHKEDIDAKLKDIRERNGQPIVPSDEDLDGYRWWKDSYWLWFFQTAFPARKEICGYSAMYGHKRGDGYVVDSEGNSGNHMSDYVRLAEPIWVRCPVCGRRIKSWIRTCHDGCCVYHCVPKHKVKKWWKLDHKKKTSKDRHMRRRG